MLFELSGLDVLALVLTSVVSFAVGKLRRSPSAEYKSAEHDMRRAKAIVQESRIDALTGVGNRRMFDQSLQSHRALYNRYGKHFSLAIIDLDHFTRINDTHGHLHGDQALSTVGTLLRELARETDVVARYGGEEFVILMPETPLDGACIFCERVRREIAAQLDLTASIGVASTEDYGATADLVHAADQALYQAKEAGRNQVFACESEGCSLVRISESDSSHEPASGPNGAELAVS